MQTKLAAILAVTTCVSLFSTRKFYITNPASTTANYAQDPSTTLPFCMDIPTSLLCSSQTKRMEDRMDCRQNAKAFFIRLLQEAKATATREEREARRLFSNLTALSIGAAKGGICKDVLPDKTLCTDRPQLDLFDYISWLKLFGYKKNGVLTLHCEHVLEHFEPIQVQQIAAAAFTMMAPGGVFRIAVPDGYKPSPSYQQYIRPGGTASGKGQRHMVAWTIDSLAPIFASTGFQIVEREHFTAKGTFVTSKDAYRNTTKNGVPLGPIKRSFRRDKRNVLSHKKEISNNIGKLKPDLQDGEPWYTSLWFDAVKPLDCNTTFVGALL